MAWFSASAPVALVLLTACGGAAPAPRGSSASPTLSGDTCALHQDPTTCRADSQGCSWYPNTRACLVGAPCPAGWCSRTPIASGGGGVAGSAACACPGGGDDACVVEIGGPAVPAPPPITCQPIPASCALPERCGCLSGAPLGTCASSDQVTNLCVCDDGIR